MNSTAENLFPEDAAQPDEATVALTPGQIIQELNELRDERKKISQRDKELVELWRVLEARLIQIGDEQGMKRISTDVPGATLTATVTEEVLPVLDSFDELWEYMKENDAPHMLQRRVAAAAFRELQSAGVAVPGLSAYVQRKISLRKTQR
jgi:hypothetical protein